MISTYMLFFFVASFLPQQFHAALPKTPPPTAQLRPPPQVLKSQYEVRGGPHGRLLFAQLLMEPQGSSMLPHKRSFEDHMVDILVLALTQRASTKLDVAGVFAELAPSSKTEAKAK